MSLLNLSENLLDVIYKYIPFPYNKLFGLTCRELLSYVKFNIKLTLMDDYKSFIDLCIKLYPNTITIENMYDPQLWLPYYPEKIIFNNCTTFDINPPEKIITQELVLTDYNRNKHKKAIHINWDKFPNLRKAQLYVYSVNNPPQHVEFIKNDLLIQKI